MNQVLSETSTINNNLSCRLWNSTLVEDYPKVDMVKIGSNAKLIIPPNVVVQQENVKDDVATVSSW